METDTVSDVIRQQRGCGDQRREMTKVIVRDDVCASAAWIGVDDLLV